MDKIGDLGEFHEGIHTGNIRGKLFHRSKPQFSDESKIKPCLIGNAYGDKFDRYYYFSNNNYVIYDSSIIDKTNGEYASLRDENIFIGPKLYITRTGDDFVSFYDEKFYASNNLFSFKFKSGEIMNNPHSYLFMNAILNSRFAQRCNRLFIAPRFGKLFTETKIIHLAMLPLRRINFTTPEDERACLVSDLKGLYAAGRLEDVLSRVEECLPKDSSGGFVTEREKSDVVHDLLAYLAEEMIEMNKEKQGEIRGFLDWLRGDMGAEVDDLSNKTKIQAYYQHGFSDLLKVLKTNKRKLKTDYSARKPQERLKEEFESSIATLTPLLARIRETDELIDQVVYKLYGLTEEEITIIDNANAK